MITYAALTSVADRPRRSPILSIFLLLLPRRRTMPCLRRHPLVLLTPGLLVFLRWARVACRPGKWRRRIIQVMATSWIGQEASAASRFFTCPSAAPRWQMRSCITHVRALSRLWASPWTLTGMCRLALRIPTAHCIMRTGTATATQLSSGSKMMAQQ